MSKYLLSIDRVLGIVIRVGNEIGNKKIVNVRVYILVE